ncbi:hypothetical protein D3C71_1228390 [compost metagenome]
MPLANAVVIGWLMATAAASQRAGTGAPRCAHKRHRPQARVSSQNMLTGPRASLPLINCAMACTTSDVQGASAQT